MVQPKSSAEYGIRIGTLFIFAVVLPGFVGFFLYTVLFDFSLIKVTLMEMVVYLLGFGFIANAVGHFIDVLLYRGVFCRLRNHLLPKRKPYVFTDFPKCVYLVKDNVARDAAEYHFAWFTFMFNSATIMFFLLFSPSIQTLLATNSFELSLVPWWKTLLLIAFSIVVFYLAHFQMVIAHDLCRPNVSEGQKAHTT